jgi:hypothetical protein
LLWFGYYDGWQAFWEVTLSELMKKQSYQNHIFYYWPHHFLFYGAVIAAFGFCGFGIYKYPAERFLWIMIAVCVFLIVLLAYMLRQHYALGNQNRIVRLEMRLRYYILTSRRFEDVEVKLSFKQIAALRFASDDELQTLINRAIADNLSPDEIKKSITMWSPDTMRV